MLVFSRRGSDNVQSLRKNVASEDQTFYCMNTQQKKQGAYLMIFDDN